MKQIDLNNYEVTDEMVTVAHTRAMLHATAELARERGVTEFTRPCTVKAIVVDEQTASDAGYPSTIDGVAVEIDNSSPRIRVRYESIVY